MTRGYFGVAVWEPKFDGNAGGLLRSAQAFDARFVWFIGRRFKWEPSDTTKAERHIPVMFSETLEDFLKAKPALCQLVSVEVNGEHDLRTFTHPERAVYLLGGEDRTLPPLDGLSVKISTSVCLNLAVAGSIVMYSRSVQSI